MLFKRCSDDSRTEKVKKSTLTQRRKQIHLNISSLCCSEIKMQCFQKHWPWWTVVALPAGQHQQHRMFSCHHSHGRAPLSLLYCLLWWCSFLWCTVRGSTVSWAEGRFLHTQLNKAGSETQWEFLTVFFQYFISLECAILVTSSYPKDSQAHLGRGRGVIHLVTSRWITKLVWL